MFQSVIARVVQGGVAIGVLALCATAQGDLPPSTAPATRPISATQPTTQSLSHPFPPEFGVLMRRSIFAHGRPVAATDPSSKPSSPDQGFVLRGVAVQGPMRTALLEDVAGSKTRQLHIGDDLIGGKVVAITMEGVDRTLGGKVLHIGVGQTLDGSATASPSTKQAVASDGPPPADAGAAPAPGTPIQASAKIIETKE